MGFKIMISVALVLTAAALCACERPMQEYLKEYDGYYEQEINWVSDRIESNAWGYSILKLPQNLNQALSSAQHSSFKDNLGVSTYDQDRLVRLKTFLQELVLINRDYNKYSNFVPCNNNQARVFTDIVNVKFGGAEKLQETIKNPPKSLLFEYLKTYGPIHAKECMESLPARYKEMLKEIPPQTEAKLDLIVTMGERYSLEKLAARAESTDLAEGEFDAKKMLEAIKSKDYLFEAKMKYKLSSDDDGELLASFIMLTCYTFHYKANIFGWYNLARVMVPESISHLDATLKFKKLNEYYRICLPFTNIRRQEAAEKNVVNNLRRSSIA